MVVLPQDKSQWSHASALQAVGTRFLETKTGDWDLGTRPICLLETEILYHS